MVSVPFTSGSSLQRIGCYHSLGWDFVSVPFTSGSSLQLITQVLKPIDSPFGNSFSSLYIGILAATQRFFNGEVELHLFQFPLHRDPRCNSMFQIPAVLRVCFSSLYIGILAATCSECSNRLVSSVSVPFTSGSSLQPDSDSDSDSDSRFQFPLHRDPRCNDIVSTDCAPLRNEFQFPLHRDPRCNGRNSSDIWALYCFSSLYIGILAATCG